jgi:hypothetical protein
VGKRVIRIAKDEIAYSRSQADELAKQHRRLVSGTKRFPEEVRRLWAELKSAWSEEGEDADSDKGIDGAGSSAGGSAGSAGGGGSRDEGDWGWNGSSGRKADDGKTK